MSDATLKISLSADERASLERLSGKSGQSVDRLASDAVRIYLRATRQDGDSLDRIDNLVTGLTEYQRHDPDFTEAMSAFVEAEATGDDPLEGTPTIGMLAEGVFTPGPVAHKIDDLLNA